MGPTPTTRDIQRLCAETLRGAGDGTPAPRCPTRARVGRGRGGRPVPASMGVPTRGLPPGFASGAHVDVGDSPMAERSPGGLRPGLASSVRANVGDSPMADCAPADGLTSTRRRNDR